jgi:hypothetical protein
MDMATAHHLLLLARLNLLLLNTTTMSSQQFDEQTAALSLSSKPSTTDDASQPPWNCAMDIGSELDGCPCSTLPVVRPALLYTSRRRGSLAASVSFSPSDKLHIIEYPDDYRRESYTEEDEALFKKEAREEIIAFRRLKEGSGTPHHHNLCMVGIEQHLISRDFVNQRERTKKLVTHAVLREQARVGSGDCVNDKAARIADASRQYSEWSASQAKMIGDFQSVQVGSLHGGMRM